MDWWSCSACMGRDSARCRIGKPFWKSPAQSLQGYQNWSLPALQAEYHLHCVVKPDCWTLGLTVQEAAAGAYHDCPECTPVYQNRHRIIYSCSPTQHGLLWALTRQHQSEHLVCLTEQKEAVLSVISFQVHHSEAHRCVHERHLYAPSHPSQHILYAVVKSSFGEVQG